MNIFVSNETKNALEKISKDIELQGYLSTKLVIQLFFSFSFLLLGITKTLIDFTEFNIPFIINFALSILFFVPLFIQSIIEINILRKSKIN